MLFSVLSACSEASSLYVLAASEVRWSTTTGRPQQNIAEMGFLQSLLAFDDKYTQKDDVQPERAEKISKPAWSLCMCVPAFENYNWVAKIVAPRKLQLS